MGDSPCRTPRDCDLPAQQRRHPGPWRYNWAVGATGAATQPSRNTAAGAFEASGAGGAGTSGFKLTTLQNGNKENVICSNRGLCDYSTGTCKCFGGFTDFDCSVQNALATA